MLFSTSTESFPPPPPRSISTKFSITDLDRSSRPRKTVGILAMKENRLPFTVKNQLTGKWRIQEIREIFVTLVHVKSRKYFQLLCLLTPVLFFLIKEVFGYK